MKRSKIDIVHDILSTVQSEGPILPTRLLYRTNLSHGRMKAYLDDLKEKGFIVLKEGKYEILDAGHKFLQDYQQMKRFLDVFGF